MKAHTKPMDYLIHPPARCLLPKRQVSTLGASRRLCRAAQRIVLRFAGRPGGGTGTVTEAGDEQPPAVDRALGGAEKT